VSRVLQLVDRARRTETSTTGFDADSHHALARAAAAECAVLLKNEDGILPLQPAAGDTIAVIGEFARTPRYQGAGSSQVNPTRVDAALDELRAAVPDGVDVPFAPGFGIGATDDQLADEAVALAARATAATDAAANLRLTITILNLRVLASPREDDLGLTRGRGHDVRGRARDWTRGRNAGNPRAARH
jgi:beta-glucosidase-like glycosyl hydrolase